MCLAIEILHLIRCLTYRNKNKCTLYKNVKIKLKEYNFFCCCYRRRTKDLTLTL